MAVNSMVMPSFSSFLVVVNATLKLSLSSSKILTTKVGGIAAVMNNFLTRHVYKISEISVCFFQANDINFFIAKATNEFTFVVFGGDFNEDGFHKFFSLLKHWDSLNTDKTSIIQVFVSSNADFGRICSVLFSIKKSYCASKLAESLYAEKLDIRSAIEKQMEDYVDNNVFSGVIDTISYEDLVHIVKNLSDGKAAGLLGIMNKLWKNCNGFVLSMLLDFLNFCLGTTTQSSIFAIGLVVEDALEKNCELWLVLQDMQKAYDSVDWYNLWNNLVKKQESLCKYCINSRFVAKTGRLENQDGLILFLAVSAFVDDTIWMESSQTATQYILDIANEFFSINNIFINNEKTVAISINRRVGKASLSISSLLISIAYKGESYKYLGIYLSSESLSKPSLVKAHSDVRFFVNLVLKKTISDKQFLYLVLAVLQFIIRYRFQFSFLSKSVCAFHHPSLYSLKSFEQLQTECKVAFVLSFLNASGLLGCLFVYRFLNLQVLSWLSVHSLCYLVRLHISSVDNFLTGVLYTQKGLIFDWKSFCYWKKLDPKSPVLYWFNLACDFLAHLSFYDSLSAAKSQLLDVGDLGGVFWLKQYLIISNLNVIKVYTDRSLKNFGMQKIRCGTAAYFSDMIALALECVSFHSSVAVLDACAAESVLWHGVVNLIKEKGLSVSWHKVKRHLGVLDNKHVNGLVDSAVSLDLVLPVLVKKMFIKAGKVVVSGNIQYFA
ncbi:hypothetical protein G9A89_007531 [Geosiphon pyriformis]|nr:hypothetical protein G9A89_007531 [Geosiphon pyriformis]